jgi:hypothetical protein
MASYQRFLSFIDLLVNTLWAALVFNSFVQISWPYSGDPTKIEHYIGNNYSLL